MKMLSAFIAAGVLIVSLGTAQAQTALTGQGGMTLYSFDKDKDGVSACYDKCAVNWPPYLGKQGDTMPAGWTLVPRNDGTMQWAHGGKPAYYYIGDKKPGDATGDGMGGVWHVLKP